MSDAPLMLGVSGLRGIVGKSITPSLASEYAQAFGNWLSERAGGSAHVAIGRDGRLGGESLHHAAIGGLLAAGCSVTDLGIASTPTVAMAAGGCDGGMIVTASHNPAEWNGLKCLVTERFGIGDDEDGPDEGLARAPSAEDAQEIIARFRAGGLGSESAPSTRSIIRDEHAAEMHAAGVFGLLAALGMPKRRFRVALDAVNASGSRPAMRLLSMLGEVVQLHCDESGVFPHTPEPTADNLAGLCSAVSALGVDAGFAVDPDADRLAIVDEQGSYIGEELTLALSAWSLLEALGDSAKGQTLCANLSTSRLIDDVAARYGARVVRTAVGEANVVQGMIDHGALLGGEGNGGVIWPELSFVRDSLAGMALVLALMGRTGKTLSQLVADLPAYAIVKRKVELADRSLADKAGEKVASHFKGRGSIDRQDGVRVDIADYEKSGQAAWLHVRASNTEPIMRLIAEARTAELAGRLLDEAAGAIG